MPTTKEKRRKNIDQPDHPHPAAQIADLSESLVLDTWPHLASYPCEPASRSSIPYQARLVRAYAKNFEQHDDDQNFKSLQTLAKQALAACDQFNALCLRFPKLALQIAPTLKAWPISLVPYGKNPDQLNLLLKRVGDHTLYDIKRVTAKPSMAKTLAAFLVDIMHCAHQFSCSPKLPAFLTDPKEEEETRLLMGPLSFEHTFSHLTDKAYPYYLDYIYSTHTLATFLNVLPPSTKQHEQLADTLIKLEPFTAENLDYWHIRAWNILLHFTDGKPEANKVILGNMGRSRSGAGGIKKDLKTGLQGICRRPR